MGVVYHNSGQHGLITMPRIFFKVAYSFMVGASAPILLGYLADFLFSAHATKFLFETKNGVIVLVFFGLVGVSWIIWEGEFIDDVKPTHWTRHRGNSN